MFDNPFSRTPIQADRDAAWRRAETRFKEDAERVVRIERTRRGKRGPDNGSAEEMRVHDTFD